MCDFWSFKDQGARSKKKENIGSFTHKNFKAENRSILYNELKLITNRLRPKRV